MIFILIELIMAAGSMLIGRIEISLLRANDVFHIYSRQISIKYIY
jgi:hypothetical protein